MGMMTEKSDFLPYSSTVTESMSVRWVGCVFRTGLRRARQTKGVHHSGTNTNPREVTRSRIEVGNKPGKNDQAASTSRAFCKAGVGCLQGRLRWPAAKCFTFAYLITQGPTSALRFDYYYRPHQNSGVTAPSSHRLSLPKTQQKGGQQLGKGRPSHATPAQQAGLHLTVSLSVGPIGLPPVRSPASQCLSYSPEGGGARARASTAAPPRAASIPLLVTG